MRLCVLSFISNAFMKIIVAQTAGFCMGVKRAVDLALDSAVAHQSTIHTIGPIIHNKQTVEMLRGRGIAPLEHNETADSSGPLLIRTHGIPPEKEDSLRRHGHEIVDGTCPKVKTVHKVIRKHARDGYAIVVAGDEGHAEVLGLQGYAGTKSYLVNRAEDVAALPELDKICLVSQTTFDRATFDEIAQEIKFRFSPAQLVIRKTICAATNKRQTETHELARRVDAMIVVGGKHSANTQRLAEISRTSGTPTQHIETEKEISFDDLQQVETVGVTAGASTPNWMIKRVVDYLQFMTQTRRRTASNLFWHLLDTISSLNVFPAVGAAVSIYASFMMQNIAFGVGTFFTAASVAFLYFMPIYLWNSLTSIEITQHLGISRYRFYSNYRPYLFALAIICIAVLLAVSAVSSIRLFYLMLTMTVIGSLYHFTIVPGPLRTLIPYGKFKDIPTSRDLLVAIAWSIVITFIPQSIAQNWQIQRQTILVFLWIFVLSYIRSVIFDLRDLEGDRIMGRETLVTFIGETRVRRAIQIMIFAAGVALGLYLCIYAAIDFEGLMQHDIIFIFQIPILIYMRYFLKLTKDTRSLRPALFSIAVDAQFGFVGILTFLGATLLSMR
ncbi:MAG: 4-hydroxy-3-methylbut-2-enyl diphosphate reductase [Chitinivibrionales bacterium]|nr:4-hydroxy-3-methylbut-2-enyl diphosphate reductase [Chitinivibrionales bacterium]